MIRFIISRLIQTIVALYILVTAVFFLVRLTGDPILMLAGAQATPAQIADLKAYMGFDKPVSMQYAIYMKNLLKGDFGKSYTAGRQVIEMILERLPNTLRLSIPAIIFGYALAFILGVTTAIKRASFYDNTTQIITAIGISTPPFFIALMLILIFSFKLNWLPPAVYGEFSIKQYIMPVFVNGVFLAPIMLQIIRSSMLQVLDSEYVKLARIKGLSERRVIWKHTLRNAMIAPLTSMGGLLVFIVSGNVIVENFFTVPGVSQLSIASYSNRDFIVVQAFVLLLGALILISNLLVDISYAIVDPQIRYKTM